MDILNRKIAGKENNLSEKIMMFGEGNFLRAFAGYIIEQLNESGAYNGSIISVQGVEEGLCDLINSQDGLYTVIERGIEKHELLERYTLINCLSRCINPYKDYDKYIQIAKSSELEVIISNTTEFGICYSAEEKKDSSIHKNFPAKLTDFLYNRFIYFKGDFNKGLVILPCELIDYNGEKLKEIVLRYAEEWELGKDFINWVNEANVFANTLVDRIVSGYPKLEADEFCKKLGYKDNLLDVCEPFMLWVIEADKKILNKLPLHKANLDIIITDNLMPYKIRKVRILNGAHTMSVLAGYLCGFETVEQIINDKTFNSYISKGIFEEIIPVINGEKLNEYANDVIERFKNPYLNHKLISISLNSVSKFKARVLPSIQDYINKFDKTPQILTFSFAALIHFYKKGINSFVNDEKRFLEIMNDIFTNSNSPEDIVNSVLKNEELWAEDLTKIKHLEKAVTKYYRSIEENGIHNALKEIVK